MPSTTFFDTATAFDASLTAAMNSVLVTSLNQIQPQITVALALYVVGQGILMSIGRVSLSSAVTACIRCMFIVAILQLPNYLFYVAQFFFTDLPDQIAAAVGGARISVASSTQFDQLWDGVAHYQGYLLGLATSVFSAPERAVTYIMAGLIYATLWVMFAFWYITRVYMALTICIGPFIILLFLWDATRGFFQRWIGMLIGLTCLSLTSTILLRILLVSMNRTLAVLTYDSGTEFTVAENAFEGVLGVFSLSMIAMFVLPATFSFGAGAAVAATNGIIVSAASRIGGTAVRGSAALGRFLGRHA